MPEIKTPVKELQEGEVYTAKAGDCLITEDHTWSDVARWVLKNKADAEELVFLLTRPETGITPVPECINNSITLRQQLALGAMRAIYSKEYEQCFPDALVSDAYRIADALLAYKEEKQ